MRKTAFFAISLVASALAFPGAAEAATSSVKCSGGGTVTASTGTSTGACVAGTGKVICKDGGKVVSQGACSSGTAICGNSTGAGTCNLSRKLVSTKPKRPPATTHR